MTETVIIGGEDFTSTDAEARAIMEVLAMEHGVTESVWARMSMREAVNRVLQVKKKAVEDLGL